MLKSRPAFFFASKMTSCSEKLIFLLPSATSVYTESPGIPVSLVKAAVYLVGQTSLQACRARRTGLLMPVMLVLASSVHPFIPIKHPETQLEGSGNVYLNPWRMQRKTIKLAS